MAQALHVLQQFLIQDPRDFTALHGAGVISSQMGHHEEALGFLARAISIQPNNFAAHYNRGKALQQINRREDALASYDRALSLKQDFIDAYSNRGIVLHDLHRYNEALASYDKAISLNPNASILYNGRGNVLRAMKRYREALDSLDLAIHYEPDFFKAYLNRAITLKDLNRYAEAAASYKRAIELNPNDAEAHVGFGIFLVEMNRQAEALDYFNQALAIDYYSRNGAGYRLHTQLHIGLWDDFEGRTADLIGLLNQDLLAAVPFHLLALPIEPRLLQKYASHFVADMYPPAHRTLWNGEHYVHERIRIGYFSADFHNHATAYLMAELFEKHDRARFDIFAFSFGPEREDEMRARLRRSFNFFFEVSARSDHDIAELACKWEIDIAVDLKGYTQNARPGIFALRPAPVQVSYLGYPGTSGAPYIDYIIADPVVIPQGHFVDYTEKVVQLPHSYQVNDSQRQIAETVPTRSALGMPEEGFVFCCFNNLFKITPDVFDIWMRLLDKVDGSVLWLFASNDTIMGNLRREAQKRSVNPERLIFAAHIEQAEHLARLRQADLFMDTFFYNAHTTTSDALWAGLPVLTCLGNTFAGRVAASLLYAMGLPEMVTHSHEEY